MSMKNIAVEVTEAVRKELGKIIPSNRTREEKNKEVEKYGIEVIKFDAYKGKEHVQFKKEFRCHGYTLGLYESSIYLAHPRKCVFRCRCPYINEDFMRSLIETLIQKEKIRKLDSPMLGSMVIYFEVEGSNSVLTHSGLVIKNNPIMVRSKWGDHPDIFAHDLWKIPHKYGSLTPEYYTRPEFEDVEEFYYEKSS